MLDELSLSPAPYPSAEAEDIDLGAWFTAELSRRLEIYRAYAADPSIRAAIDRRCAEDFLFWTDNFAWTHDQRPVNEVRPANDLPFVLWEFQRSICRAGNEWTDDYGNLWSRCVYKSRDMGASWISVAEWVWGWNFHGWNYGIIARKEEDVDDNTSVPQTLLGRVRWMIMMMPRLMRPRTWRREKLPRFDNKYLKIINSDKKNQIRGTSTVDHAFRSLRFRRVFVDEANSIDGLDKLMRAVLDCAEAVDLVSSVGGRHTYFASIVHGEAGDITSIPSDGTPPRGVGAWLVHKLHYSLHPHKNPATLRGRRWREAAEAKRKGLGEAAWAQEQECDFYASIPNRCWPEFDRAKHCYSRAAWEELIEPALWMAESEHLELWDYGYGSALTVRTEAVYVPSWDVLYIVRSQAWVDADVDMVAQDVGAKGVRCLHNPSGRMPDRRLGDPSGSNRGPRQFGGRHQDAAPSWVENLALNGIDVAPIQVNPYTGIQLVRTKLREGAIFFGPECSVTNDPRLPTMVDCVESHQWRTAGGAVTLFNGQPKPAKNTQSSHHADTLIYAAAAVFKELHGIEMLEQSYDRDAY